jgi:hypothetical protein
MTTHEAPTDHDRAIQERFNRDVDAQRQAGHITVLMAEWVKHHYHVGEGWRLPDTDIDYDYQSELGDVPPAA